MLKLYNSYSKKLEAFKPRRGKEVAMYNCGPTVYGYQHIGNMRSFLFADLLRRYLEYKGMGVKQVMNITDVGHALADADVGEDKVEEAAKKAKTSVEEIVQKYSAAFFDDITRLNVRPAAHYPKASEHVPEMIGIIETLLKQKHAYQADGDVYYDVDTFPKYGTLSGNTPEQLRAGARVEVNPKKRHPYDFALWIHNPHHLMQWTAPWGTGYPGWHIECSAMGMKYLGETLDIHTGGEDNKFPHHECEIAQSEGATGKPFARFWLHAAHMSVDGQKMSKSLGNIIRVADLLGKGFDARAIRYALIASHYREHQNFTMGALDSARSAVERLDAVLARLLSSGSEPQKPVKGFNKKITALKKDFESALDDDLNVPRALGVLFGFVREANSALDEGLAPGDRTAAIALLSSLTRQVLGIELGTGQSPVPVEVTELLAEREKARKAKDFLRADQLRDAILQRGYEVLDAKEGARLKKR